MQALLSHVLQPAHRGFGYSKSLLQWLPIIRQLKRWRQGTGVLLGLLPRMCAQEPRICAGVQSVQEVHALAPMQPSCSAFRVHTMIQIWGHYFNHFVLATLFPVRRLVATSDHTVFSSTRLQSSQLFRYHWYPRHQISPKSPRCL